MVNTNVKRIQNENTILSTYLKEINKIPLLSREEEYDLAIKAVAGDKDAQDKLIKANLRFVVNVAKNIRIRAYRLWTSSVRET